MTEDTTPLPDGLTPRAERLRVQRSKIRHLDSQLYQISRVTNKLRLRCNALEDTPEDVYAYLATHRRMRILFERESDTHGKLAALLEAKKRGKL